MSFARKLILAATAATLASSAPAAAAVDVERHGAENPMVEIFRSTIYGALAGVVVGGAIALATDGSDGDEDVMRWSIVTGTAVGLAYGIYWVNRRPQPSAMLELEGGDLHVRPLPGVSLAGGPKLHVVAVRF
jgi:hypothetical protein